MPYNKLIFVDADGTCRSAMCRIIMKSKFLLQPIEVEARGLVVLFPEPLDAKAQAALEVYEYTVDEYPAVQLSQEDMAEDVLILTMEERQKQKIWEQFEHVPHVYTLAEFIHYSGDILPLYGEPVEAYGEWVLTMDKLLDELVICLNENTIHANAATQKEQENVLEENASKTIQEDEKDVGQTNGLSDLG